jgi:hypothetical protein
MITGRKFQTATGDHGPKKENSHLTVPTDNPDAFSMATSPNPRCCGGGRGGGPLPTSTRGRRRSHASGPELQRTQITSSQDPPSSPGQISELFYLVHFDFLTLSLSGAQDFPFFSTHSPPLRSPLPISTIPAIIHEVRVSVYSPIGRRDILRPSGCNAALSPLSSSPGHHRAHRAAPRCTLR